MRAICARKQAKLYASLHLLLMVSPRKRTTLRACLVGAPELTVSKSPSQLDAKYVEHYVARRGGQKCYEVVEWKKKKSHCLLVASKHRRKIRIRYVLFVQMLSLIHI